MIEADKNGLPSTGAGPVAADVSFEAPAEAVWHRMISEAAYFIAEKRGFGPGDAADDWLRAEESVRMLLKKHEK